MFVCVCVCVTDRYVYVKARRLCASGFPISYPSYGEAFRRLMHYVGYRQ